MKNDKPSSVLFVSDKPGFWSSNEVLFKVHLYQEGSRNTCLVTWLWVLRTFRTYHFADFCRGNLGENPFLGGVGFFFWMLMLGLYSGTPTTLFIQDRHVRWSKKKEYIISSISFLLLSISEWNVIILVMKAFLVCFPEAFWFLLGVTKPSILFCKWLHAWWMTQPPNYKAWAARQQFHMFSAMGWKSEFARSRHTVQTDGTFI